MKKNLSHRTKESVHWNNLLSWPYVPHYSWDLSPCFHGRWLRWRSSVRTVAWASVWKPAVGIITSALFYLRDLWVAVASCSVEMNCSRYVLPYLISHSVVCLICDLAINTCGGSTSYMYVLYVFLIYFIYTHLNVHRLSIIVPQWLATKQKQYVRCQHVEFQPPEPIELKYNTQTNKPNSAVQVWDFLSLSFVFFHIPKLCCSAEQLSKPTVPYLQNTEMAIRQS